MGGWWSRLFGLPVFIKLMSALTASLYVTQYDICPWFVYGILKVSWVSIFSPPFRLQFPY